MTEDRSPVIEICDPALDGQAIARLVQQQAARRLAENAGRLDRAALSPEPLQPGSVTLGRDVAPPGFPGLRESLAELIGRGHLDEPDFKSDTPLIGPAIVAVRRLWNWMSAKWYVRPVLWQQSDVNARTTRAISDLANWHELDARRLGQLEAQVAELEARRLDQLEARVAELEARLVQIEAEGRP
jgi:transcription elongation GreA/GreB family factor